MYLPLHAGMSEFGGMSSSGMSTLEAEAQSTIVYLQPISQQEQLDSADNEPQQVQTMINICDSNIEEHHSESSAYQPAGAA